MEGGGGVCVEGGSCGGEVLQGPDDGVPLHPSPTLPQAPAMVLPLTPPPHFPRPWQWCFPTRPSPTLPQALKMVRALNPPAEPNEGYWAQLLLFQDMRCRCVGVCGGGALSLQILAGGQRGGGKYYARKASSGLRE